MSKTLILREPQNSSQLHTVLRERLRETLLAQPPGEKVSSERILAKEFGVSTATVSRALQELQQEGILRRIPGKGTFLSPAAPDEQGEDWAQNKHFFADNPENSLGRAPSYGAQGYGTPNWLGDSSVTLPIQEGIREVSETKLNAWIIVQLEPEETQIDRSSESWPHRIVSRLEYRITSQGGKARTVTGHTLSEEQCVESWKAALDEGINCVFFIVNERNPLVDVWSEQFIQRHIGSEQASGGEVPPVIVQISLSGMQYAYFDTVSFDGEWGAYLATAHLLAIGHRNIAFLAPPSKQEWLQHRIRGFHRALRSYGIQVPRDDHDFGVIHTAPVPEGTQMWTLAGKDAVELIASNDSLSAVLVANDQMALTFIQGATALGRRVPETLSVVGYDDRFDSAMQGITTVHPPIEDIADASLQLAERRLNGPTQQGHVHLMLKPALMVRGTTRPFTNGPSP